VWAAVLGGLVVFLAAVTTFVRLYEEPTLRRAHGTSYEEYAAAVRRWIPRVRPWTAAGRR
jgi:protein-S-isoprenylcysteine O-methyltransferase Ste14